MNPHILVADDQPYNLLILQDLLGEHYEVEVAADGVQALNFIRGGGRVDLVLLDIMMPGLDGFEVCRLLKASPGTRDIPIIFLTSLDSAADEEKGLSLGAEDFIHKPFSPPVVLARVRNHLMLARARKDLLEKNENLERLVEERTREVVAQSRELVNRSEQLSAAQGVTINAFCSLAEARDNETGNHIRRTQLYVLRLAEALRDHPRFQDVLDDETLRLLYKSAPLHDIGKVGIPDAILLKPGKLTPEEWVVMQGHCVLGRNAIARAAEGLDGKEWAFLRHAMDIAFYHHERWDGSGYPNGLAGDDIPVSARLMAAADVYDALISRRVYKPPFSHQKAMDIIFSDRGKHFDPDVADAVMELSDQFREIASSYSDEPHVQAAA
ncbi:MAG: response regulator [Rhodocyclaceae bacterium]|nr:response regulator [Rhodocyclaceae bacterium]